MFAQFNGTLLDWAHKSALSAERLTGDGSARQLHCCKESLLVSFSKIRVIAGVSMLNFLASMPSRRKTRQAYASAAAKSVLGKDAVLGCKGSF